MVVSRHKPTLRGYNSTDNAASAALFEKHVWPELHKTIGGDIIRIEGTCDLVQRLARSSGAAQLQSGAGHLARLLQLFDFNGWDYCHDSVSHMRGLAVRIQKTRQERRVFRTVTLRTSRFDKEGKRTAPELIEIHRRYAAYKQPHDGWINPGLTIHAYVDMNGALWRVGVVRTHDICALIEKNGGPDSSWLKRRIVPIDNAEFAWFEFSELPMVLVLDPFGDAIRQTRTLASTLGLVPAAKQVAAERGWTVRAAYLLGEHIWHNHP